MWGILNEILQWTVLIYILYVLVRLSIAQTNAKNAIKIIKYIIQKNKV